MLKNCLKKITSVPPIWGLYEQPWEGESEIPTKPQEISGEMSR